MHSAIYWFGFLGAWLLVAGPIYQASVELRAEDEASERWHRAMDGLPAPAPVSSWWWLLPPVRWWLTGRRRGAYQRIVLDSLSAEDLETFARYANIARGWMLVGFGAFLIALKETYELSEHYEWHLWVYWPLVVAMLLITLGATASTAGRERAMRAPARG